MLLRPRLPNLFLLNMLPLLDSIIHNKYNRVPPQYSKMFRMMTSSREAEQATQLSGMGLLKQVGEGAPVSYDEPVKGYDSSYIHAQYALGFRASRILADDDRHSIIKKMAADLGRSAKETVEILAASVYNNAFSGSFLGPDGVALCSTSHPLIKAGGVQSNRAAAYLDLTPTNLQTVLTACRRMVDSSGRRVRIPFNQLVVPPELEFVASEVLGGSMRSDTANNTINALRERGDMESFRKFFVYDYLTSATNWFVKAAPEDTEIRFYWREKFNTIHDVDFDTRSLKTAGWMRFSYGWSDFYGIYGVA